MRFGLHSSYFFEDLELWIYGAVPARPAPSSAQGGGMGALDTGIDRPGHPRGAGAPGRVRQCGHRAELPGSWRGSRISYRNTYSL